MRSFDLDPELHAALTEFARQHGHSTAEALACGLAVYLTRIAWERGVAVEAKREGHEAVALRIDLERSFLAATQCLKEAGSEAWPDDVTLRLSVPQAPALWLRMSADGRFPQIGFAAGDMRGDDRELDALCARLRTLLPALLADARGPLCRQPLLPADERRLVLQTWNQTAAPYPDDCGIHQLFERQAARTPTATALVCGARRLSYGELDAAANRLARALRQRGVSSSSLVALLVEREIEAIIGIFGVLKAGAAYVPLDPTAPVERLRFILQDTQAALLLSTGRLAQRLAAAEIAVPQAALDEDTWYAGYAPSPLSPDEAAVAGGQLAYVIYTSGSTGKPKGVLIEHRSVCNHCTAWQRLLDQRPGHRPGRRVLQASPLFFDASVWEIFPTLTSGAELHLPSPEARLPGPELLALLRQQRIEVLGMTPSALAALPIEETPADLPDLKVVLAGGEACPAQLVARFAPGRQMWNGYGPTEATCDATATLCHDDGQPPTIGRPLPNVRAYVLDAWRQPLPVAVPGELYIGGVGVGRGYLNHPQLTAQKFLADPFALAADARMYATGDLVRWRHDGQLEYLGRIDQQIKLRGHRIELGEIETALAEHPDIKDARAAVPKDGRGAPRLVGYIVPRAGRQPTVTALRAHLEARLPTYMIPAAFVFLRELPLSVNGKLELDAVPVPAFERELLGSDLVLPRNHREQQLVQIFSSVLGVNELGVCDDFFALGGDSIAALSCVARAAQEGLRFSVQDLFRNRSIERLAGCVQEQPIAADPQASALASEPRVRRLAAAYSPADFPLCGLGEAALQALIAQLDLPAGDAIEDLYPLSPMQEGMVFHTLLSRGSAVYYEQTQHTMVGALDPERLLRAWQCVIDRQPVLRTAFLVAGLERPLQCVHATATLPFCRHDLRALSTEARAQRIEQIAALRRTEGFALDRAPLLRVDLMQTGEQAYTLLLGFHHALLDGWSEPKLLAEVVSTYDALVSGDLLPRPPARSLRDYLQWLSGQDLASAEAFFRHNLAGISTATPLPGLLAPAHRDGPTVKQSALLTRVLPAALDASLRRVAQAGRITLGTLFQSAFALLLLRTTAEDVVVFGTTVSGRPPVLPEIESRLGLFINTLPLCAAFDEQAPFIEWARRLQEVQAAAREFEAVPLVKVHGYSDVPRGQPLFDCVLVYENYPREPGALCSQSGWRVVDVRQHEMTNFALTVAIIPGRELTLKFEYDRARFEPGAVERLLGWFEGLLQSIADDASRLLHELPLSAEPEPAAFPERGHSPQLPCIGNPPESIHELLAAQARRVPDAAALQPAGGGAAISYDRLERQANQLARQLIGAGLQPQSPVGLFLHDGMARVLGMLAIWKAGGVYVPLDPDHPDERLRRILQDLAAADHAGGPRSLLLSQASVATRLAAMDSPLPRLCFEDLQAMSAQQAETPPAPQVRAEAASYIIYTSGSTGQPKGVVVTHGNIVHSTMARLQFYGQPVQRCLQLASPMFDSSLAEMLWTLASGGTLIIPAPGQKTPAGLRALLADHAISHLLLVPSLYRQILEATETSSPLAALRTVVLGGEALPPALAEQHYARLPSTALYNEYGPTEATIWATVYRVPQTVLPDGAVPIGKAIPGAEIVVMDRHGQPLPIGLPGEIYVGGAGVAHGYLNQPERTAQRFVWWPRNGAQPQRLYRSGDRGRFLPDGNLDFLGRLDEQVKLRGFRIEPGEIEAALLSHPEVQACVVVVRSEDGSEPRLVAYVVPSRVTDEPPTVSSLREHLADRVPYYMLPAAFVFLSALPRMASGKVDRRALPAPVPTQVASTYVAPRTPTEQLLADLFAELLGCPRVGVHDDFFVLGGHSLLCIQVASRAAQAGIDIAVADVYMRPTVAELAAKLGPPAKASCLMPLAVGGRAGAIIFLPAVGGHLSAHILQLARGLRGERPVYGLTTPPHAGTGEMPRTLSSLCARYAQELQAGLAPAAYRGPLVLVGYCFGGVAALELACQLQQAGISVEQVILLEAVAPHLEGHQRESFDRVAALLRVAERWDLRLPTASLRTQSEEQVTAQIMAAASRADSPLAKAYTARTLRAIVDTQEACRDMLPDWAPRLPSAPVQLIRAADQIDPAIPWDYGWSALGTLTGVCSVPGDHFGFIRSPHIEQTLEHLRALIFASATKPN